MEYVFGHCLETCMLLFYFSEMRYKAISDMQAKTFSYFHCSFKRLPQDFYTFFLNVFVLLLLDAVLTLWCNRAGTKAYFRLQAKNRFIFKRACCKRQRNETQKNERAGAKCSYNNNDDKNNEIIIMKLKRSNSVINEVCYCYCVMNTFCHKLF